mmetsp:Transcript_18768/g.50373  ORF Transcript_18768/g.50373 Transcript_18768/m.50373 type:complete len:214 (-) Transcript_18768:30-671(-)
MQTSTTLTHAGREAARRPQTIRKKNLHHHGFGPHGNVECVEDLPRARVVRLPHQLRWSHIERGDLVVGAHDVIVPQVRGALLIRDLVVAFVATGASGAHDGRGRVVSHRKETVVGVLVTRDVEVHAILLKEGRVGGAHRGVGGLGRVHEPRAVTEGHDPRRLLPICVGSFQVRLEPLQIGATGSERTARRDGAHGSLGRTVEVRLRVRRDVVH